MEYPKGSELLYCETCRQNVVLDASCQPWESTHCEVCEHEKRGHHVVYEKRLMDQLDAMAMALNKILPI